MKNVLTLETTIVHLKKIFPNPSKDRVTKEEMYLLGEKNPQDKSGKSWFKNELGYFRHYDLIETDFTTVNGLPKIISIRLNQRGKIALNWIEGKLEEIVPDKKIVKADNKNEKKNSSSMDIAELITKLSEKISDKNIIYDTNKGTISLQPHKG